MFVIKYKVWREVVIYNLKNIKLFKENKNIKFRRYIFLELWEYIRKRKCKKIQKEAN